MRVEYIADNLKLNDYVKLTWDSGEENYYVVGARNERYIILSDMCEEREGWFNYTIIDLKEKKIGTDNTILSMGYEDFGGCRENLSKLESGELEMSKRRINDISSVEIEVV